MTLPLHNLLLLRFFLFYLKEEFLIENQQSATDYRYGPCLYVDSKTDGDSIKVTGCNETDERQNWAYTLKGQVKVTTEHPSALASPTFFVTKGTQGPFGGFSTQGFPITQYPRNSGSENPFSRICEEHVVCVKSHSSFTLGGKR